MLLAPGRPVRPLRVRLAIATIAAAIAAVAGLGADSASAQSGCSNARAAATSASATTVGAAVRCLVNRHRSASGLRPLRASGHLGRAARRHAVDMVRRDYFAHVSPEGRTMAQRVKRTGYLSGARRWALGEDIGWAGGGSASAAGIVDAWMKSRGHRAVILDRRFHEVGLGVASGVPNGGSGATFVLDAGMAR